MRLPQVNQTDVHIFAVNIKSLKFTRPWACRKHTLMRRWADRELGESQSCRFLALSLLALCLLVLGFPRLDFLQHAITWELETDPSRMSKQALQVPNYQRNQKPTTFPHNPPPLRVLCTRPSSHIRLEKDGTTSIVGCTPVSSAHSTQSDLRSSLMNFSNVEVITSLPTPDCQRQTPPRNRKISHEHNRDRCQTAQNRSPCRNPRSPLPRSDL